MQICQQQDLLGALPVSPYARFHLGLKKFWEISKFLKIVSIDPAFDQPMDQCHVCGDLAVAHMHYGGVCCYSCKVIREHDSTLPVRRMSNQTRLKGRIRNIIQLASIRLRLSVFRELLSLRCINLKNLSAHHQEELLRIPKHPQHLKFAWF